MRSLPSLLAPVAGLVIAGLLAFAPVASAAGASPKDEFRPNPQTYICPNAARGGVDCFLDAVEHLYTMCRQVKSIEIIEYGYEQAEQGVNGAKSEYCVDKHRLSITRPYEAALKEASGSRTALAAIRALHDLWLHALGDLKWHPPESDSDYKERVGKPYEVFRERAAEVRTALLSAPAPQPTRAAATRHASRKRTH